MGHRVSTPRNCSHNDSARGNAATVATSLAILLALASATPNTVSASPLCCGCFVSQQPQHTHWLLPTASATSSSSTSLHASSTAIAAAAATVPPPNSRLGGRLRQQSQTSSLQRRQPPVDRRNVGTSGRTDLRYATYGSHEEALSGTTDNGSSGESSTLTLTSSPWRNRFLSKKANTIEEEEEQQMQAEGSFNRAQKDDTANNNALVTKKQNGRKRARMLRFLDKRLTRLQLKYHQNVSSISSNSTSINSSNSNDSDYRRRLDYEQRKAAWAAKYTSVSTLRQSFGKNKNRLWGDFDPSTTRKLYHTLLPRALLELRGLKDGFLLANDVVDGHDEEDRKRKQKHSEQKRTRLSTEDEGSKSAMISDILNMNNLNNSPDYLQQELKELAPLAYQARLAAKKYARERSRLPGRIGSMLYDGYRSWRRYGKWKSSGMTWEQVWKKYEDQVLREAERDAQILFMEGADMCSEDDDENCVPPSMEDIEEEGLDDEELTARICLRILERSVVTNDAIDKLFLKRLAEDDTTTGDVGESSSATATTDKNDGNNVIQESKKRQQRRHRIRKRKSRIQADLRSIETKFDDDIRELLRYSTLTTREGEERRSRKKKSSRGAFAFSQGGGGDDAGDGNSAVTDTSAPIAATATVTADTWSELNLELDDSSSSINKEDEEADVITAPASVDDATTAAAAATTADDDHDDAKLRKLAVHEVFALRILATTKQRIASLQALPQLGGGGGSDTDTEQTATTAAATVKDENDQ